MYYAIINVTTSVCYISTSIMTNFRKRQLTFRGWVPYNYSSFVIFCLTFAHQCAGTISATLVNVACDSLIVGMLLHLCCQFTILQYRLKGIISGQNTVSDCVRQHIHIIKLSLVFRIFNN